MSIDDLKTKVIELGVQLGIEIEPETTKAKLNEQIKALEIQLAESGDSNGGDGGGGTQQEKHEVNNSEMVTVRSNLSGKLVTEFNGEPFTIVGEQQIPLELAKSLKKHVTIIEDA